MQVLRFAALTTCLVSLLFTGCPPPPPTGNANTNSGGNGLGQVGDPVSLQQRNATLAAIDDVLVDQSPENLLAAQAAVAQRLATDPAIAKFGVNPDGSVWARFTDGRPLVVALNHPLPDDVATGLKAAGTQSPRQAGDSTEVSGASGTSPQAQSSNVAKAAIRSQTEDAPSIPHGDRVYLFNNYGPSLEVDQHLSLLDGWLAEGGYRVINAGDAQRGTIENLRFVTDAAVVYINGRGAVGYLAGESEGAPEREVYALGTLTLRADDGSTDGQYESELLSGAVGYISSPTVILLPGTGQRFGRASFHHYFISSFMIRQRWNFVPGAQVYLDSDSGLFKNEFAQACIDKGAAVFFGWSGDIRLPDALETSQYYFSRALGATGSYDGARVHEESPPQRPFDSTTLLVTHMPQTPRTTPHEVPFHAPTMLTESFSLLNALGEGEGLTSNLTMLQGRAVDPLLRPGIGPLNIQDDPENILTHESGSLSIGGNFGYEIDDTLVTVGGEEATLVEGTTGFLDCRIGPITAGDVQVTQFGHTSNARKLSMWTGTAEVRQFGPQVISRNLTLKITLRADLQNYRLRPGEPPDQWAGGFSSTCEPMSSSIQSHEVSGTIHCNRMDRSDDVYSTASAGSYPPMRPLGESGPGFYFTRGSPPPAINLDEQAWRGTFVWGATIADGERHQVNCTENPRSQNELFDSPQGGVEIFVGEFIGYSLFDSDTIESTGPTGSTVISELKLNGMSLPTTNDPR